MFALKFANLNLNEFPIEAEFAKTTFHFLPFQAEFQGKIESKLVYNRTQLRTKQTSLVLLFKECWSVPTKYKIQSQTLFG